mgnify:FL=1
MQQGIDNMDVIKRITELTRERGWSTYRLAQKSGLSASTIANIYRRNTVPSLSTLEALCDAFGITLSQFFAKDTDAVPLTPEQKEMFQTYDAMFSDTMNQMDFTTSKGGTSHERMDESSSNENH